MRRHVHASATVLYVCVPTYNEATTVGVLLWRLRTALQQEAGGRDYEIVVYDDASTDATPDVLAPYTRVVPLTVLRGEQRLGPAGAVDALIGHVLARAAGADVVALVQADYTDAPELLTALLAPLDAGADVVVTRRPIAPAQPPGERRLRRLAPLLLGPLLRGAGAPDALTLLSSFRLFRVSVLRRLSRVRGAPPAVTAPGWAATAELLLRAARVARRIEVVDAPGRYDVRTRASRIEWTRELRGLVALAWRHRRLRESGEPAPEVSDEGRRSRAPRPRRALPSSPSEVGHIADAASDIVSNTPSDPAAQAGDQEPRTGASRRRRGRGRRRASEKPGDVAVPATATDAAPVDLTPESRPLTLVASEASDVSTGGEPSDAANSPAADEAAGSVKRPRRRGGARRRGRDSARENGVERPDTNTARTPAAPSDQLPS